MISGMLDTIDTAGRIGIPKKLRDQAALSPDIPIEVAYSDGAIHIRPAPAAALDHRRRRVGPVGGPGRAWMIGRDS